MASILLRQNSIYSVDQIILERRFQCTYLHVLIQDDNKKVNIFYHSWMILFQQKKVTLIEKGKLKWTIPSKRQNEQFEILCETQKTCLRTIRRPRQSKPSLVTVQTRSKLYIRTLESKYREVCLGTTTQCLFVKASTFNRHDFSTGSQQELPGINVIPTT